MMLPPETLALALKLGPALGGVWFGIELGGWEGCNWGLSLASVLPLRECIVLGQRLHFFLLGFPRL